MNFRDLRIYQLADQARNDLYKEIIKIPDYWTIPEVDQMIRSSASTTSNIVEGYGRKFYQRDFFRFLSIALASSDETQNHIRVLYMKGYLNKKKTDTFGKLYRKISIQILNLMNVIRIKQNFNLHEVHMKST